jgi:hypothetical protein
MRVQWLGRFLFMACVIAAAAGGCAPKPLMRPELAPRIRTPGSQPPEKPSAPEGKEPRESPQPAVEPGR